MSTDFQRKKENAELKRLESVSVATSLR